MNEPRSLTLEERRNMPHLSPLMRAKMRAQKGEVVNFCPYGCDLREIDENGYCRHLVGFTLPGNPKLYEPMVRVGKYRRVLVQQRPIPGALPINPAAGEEELKENVYEEVKEGDQLVKITVSSRVYRDVDGRGEAMKMRKLEEQRRERLEQRKMLLDDLKNDPDIRAMLLEDLTKPVEPAQVGQGDTPCP